MDVKPKAPINIKLFLNIHAKYTDQDTIRKK